MKILIASDSFKGSMSSKHIADIVSDEAKKIFENCEIVKIPVADGGEGTIDALISVLDGKKKKLEVTGPLFQKIETEIGIVDNKNLAIIEMAKAAGLNLVDIAKRDPRYTTTYGVGELIKYALDNGYKNIIISIGGSSTNDGGIGAIQALGGKFLDKDKKEVKGIGDCLKDIHSIDISNLHPKIKDTNFTVMCDVKNPLTGENGATRVYSKQKGATKNIEDYLELGMLNYEKVLKKYMHLPDEEIPGAGAAGGLGIALKVFLNATLQSGINTMLETINFEERLKDVDLVITGEGQMDWQSAFGKVPCGIGLVCKKLNIPVIAIVGSMGKGAEDIYNCGINTIIPTINSIMTLDEAIKNSDVLLASATRRILKAVKIGLTMK
ncbi:glycerate kinase family protein [Defluviitalea phaphyphila]|uniref:glycerate kinase family protein n=1 Tax=Defluviitalea phaphyphila TaxID=1473580 RepID=UPI00072FAC59|nr:glycerate kinase [Defluviitalea phaphyphila]